MEITLDMILLIVIQIIILIIGYWRFKVKLEVELAKMWMNINENKKDIQMNRDEFQTELDKHAKERKADNLQNAKEHKEMVNVLHKVDVTVARIETKVSALAKK